LLASDWQVSSSKLERIPSTPQNYKRPKTSSLIVLKSQSQEKRGKRGREGVRASEWEKGGRERSAGEERTKETQERGKEGGDPGGKEYALRRAEPRAES
jgi:hypothetical protein